MRERQVDHPAAADRPTGHGPGWWLEDGGVVEHGGGSLGVASLLRFSPRLGIAAVVLTNAEGGSALAEDRQHRMEVRQVAGRLLLSDALHGDLPEMAHRAGTTVASCQHELRPVRGDTFMIIDEAGQGSGLVEFPAGTSATVPASSTAVVERSRGCLADR
jgi:hypothetical protein